jgi:hypothetical protein
MANALEIHASGGMQHLATSIIRVCLGALLLACFICIIGNVKTESDQMEALQWMYLASGASMILVTCYQIYYASDHIEPLIVPDWFDGILFMFALCVGSVGFANDSVISNNSSPVQATGATGPTGPEPTSELSDTTISFIRATNALSILFGVIGFIVFALWVKKITKPRKPVVAQQYVIRPESEQAVMALPTFVEQ